MMEEDARRWRTVAAGILLGLGFLVALGRLFQLQVIRADELAQLAGRQYQKMLTVEGGRGAIFDRNGKILAITMDVPSVFGAPKYVSDPRATAVRLSRVRSEEHTSELQSRLHLVCRLLLEKKKKKTRQLHSESVRYRRND